MSDLIVHFNLDEGVLAHMTSAVQLGFITGTFTYALLAIADRLSPSKVFLSSALLGSIFNLLIIRDGNSYLSLLMLRFLTGFFLAGIYPVGMKIAADYFKQGLGKSLGYLVGALVLGTALPHLLKELTQELAWQSVIVATSILAAFGGILLVILVSDGPYRKAGKKLDIFAFSKVFKDKQFRSAALGYFGHMWELYAFWAFVPTMLIYYNDMHPTVQFNVPVLSFLIIGVGGLSCILSGYLSEHWGVKQTAFIALILSCSCCLFSPIIFLYGSQLVFILFLIFWGMMVIADSPLFSTLVANSAPTEIKGTALTIVNCIGFAISIVSIQLLGYIASTSNGHYLYTALSLGPLIGLLILSKSLRTDSRL